VGLNCFTSDIRPVRWGWLWLGLGAVGPQAPPPAMPRGSGALTAAGGVWAVFYRASNEGGDREPRGLALRDDRLDGYVEFNPSKSY